MRFKEYLNEAREVKRFVFPSEVERKKFEKELKKMKTKFQIYSKNAITVDMDMVKVFADKGRISSIADELNAKIEDGMK